VSKLWLIFFFGLMLTQRIADAYTKSSFSAYVCFHQKRFVKKQTKTKVLLFAMLATQTTLVFY
jgi:hypothetical protein